MCDGCDWLRLLRAGQAELLTRLLQELLRAGLAGDELLPLRLGVLGRLSNRLGLRLGALQDTCGTLLLLLDPVVPLALASGDRVVFEEESWHGLHGQRELLRLRGKLGCGH